MLTYLETHNIFFTDVYIEDIADMKYQVHRLHFEQYFIQQKYDQDFLTCMLELRCL